MSPMEQKLICSNSLNIKGKIWGWFLRGESHIDFCMQCIIMISWLGGTVTNDVLKFKKVIGFESSCIVIYFSYIYVFIDGKRFII